MIKEVRSELLHEMYYEIDHSSGLKVFVWPKEGYNSTYAIIGTPFGSINNTFISDGKPVTVPDGIAHYLEHKLFESEEGDAFTLYASTGASANAYTSFDKTCYLFSCTDNFERCLEILLGFVTNPYFTAETVKKEQGIIGQEIKMYDDSPDWKVMFNMLSGMYHSHPVRIDIAGTVESIADITAESLYKCYNSYYALSNMTLTVVGKVDVQTVIDVCDKILTKSKSVEVESRFPTEPYEVRDRYIEERLPVAVPIFNLGFKAYAEKRISEKDIACIDILLFLLASSVSPMYRELMDRELINSTFSYEQFEGPGYFAVIFGGESRDPETAKKLIIEHIERLRRDGITEEEFICAKRATYGDAISSLNSVDTSANLLEDFSFSKRKVFDYYEAVSKATLEDVLACLDRILDTNNYTLSVIKGED